MRSWPGLRASPPRIFSPTPTRCCTTRCTATTTGLTCCGSFPACPSTTSLMSGPKMGQELLDLHIGFEEAEPWPLRRTDETPSAGRRRQRMVYDEPKVVLQAGKQSGSIYLDDETTLMGVPPEAWEYQLGSRSALRVGAGPVQGKEARDPTIAENGSTPTASPTIRSR